MTRSLILALSLVASSLSAQTIAPNSLSIPSEGAVTIVIPVAGATPGANNTFFRSDVTIINLRNVEQRVRVQWHPFGRSGLDVQPQDIVLPAQSGFFSEDFVTNVLRLSGLGSMSLQAITADGVADVNGRIYATSRIWTPQPGTTGTVSQTSPVLQPYERSDNPPKWIFGVRRDERYRLNVGVMNRAAEPQRFRIQTIGSTPPGVGEVVEVDVEARSMTQVNITGAAAGSFQIIVQNVSAINRGQFEAWASSVDNVTGDAWTMFGFHAPVSTP